MNLLHKRFTAAALVLAAALAGGCASEPPSSPPGVGLAQIDAALRGSDTSFGIRLAVNPAQVAIGDSVRLAMATSRAGYVYIYQLDTDGQRVVPVFPNAVDGANYLPAGAVDLPRQNWNLVARGPAGQGYFVAVLTAEPLDLTLVARNAAQGRITTPERYGAAMSTLREVAR
ncbi:MAG: DUF4384 domain-containing protein [Rubrivivax sp.]|nr:DUF4384 domain-containing protein [Rubrivivax sp.]